MTRVALAAFIAIALVSTAVMASTPYEPPEGGDEWQKVTVVLTGTSEDADAAGKAVLACNMAETQHRIQASAQKLTPRATYSVWLVKLNDEGKLVRQLRCDNPDRQLRADKNGKLSLAANLPSCPQGKYNMVVVRLHPEGDPKDRTNMVTVMKGAIP